jgi:transcriptional regulator with XRE-family HTH domain
VLTAIREQIKAISTPSLTRMLIAVKYSILILPMTRTSRPTVKKGFPDPTDKHVGSRVRMRRIMLSMSQRTLGAAVGVSFQQLQKYENGKNRIGASRLQYISGVLQVPVAFFFDGAPDVPIARRSWDADSSLDSLTDFMATREGLSLAKAFMRINRIDLRRRIADLVEQIGNRNEIWPKEKEIAR